MSEEEIQYLLTVNVDNALSDLKKLEAVLMNTMSLARRATGDENIREGIAVLQRGITVARMLQTTITMLMSATPFGIIMGLISLGTTAYMAQDFIEYNRRGL